MLRKLVLVLLPIVLLGAACSGGGGGSATKPTLPAGSSVRDANGDGIYDSSQPAVVSSDTPVATATAPSPPTNVSNDIPTPSDPNSSSASTGSASLFGALNPLDLLDASSGDQSAADVDPALSQTLLDLADLPAGFTSIDDLSRSATTDLGDISYLMSIFANGDLENGDFQTIVGSAAMSLSPEALAEFNRQGGMDALGNMSDEMQSLQDQAAQLGVMYNDVRALDASGLGDGGGGIHFVIDMSALLGAFGTPEDNPFAGGLAADMYIFLRGDHVFMLVVMWPGDQSSGVDSQGLAAAMDAKAAAAGY
jgi:hypothetical protein